MPIACMIAIACTKFFDCKTEIFKKTQTKKHKPQLKIYSSDVFNIFHERVDNFNKMIKDSIDRIEANGHVCTFDEDYLKYLVLEQIAQDYKLDTLSERLIRKILWIT